jgi:hypothetical protein
MGIGGSFQRDKLRKREANQPSPCTTEVQNTWSFISILYTIFRGMVLSQMVTVAYTENMSVAAFFFSAASGALLWVEALQLKL